MELIIFSDSLLTQSVLRKKKANEHAECKK